MRHVRVVVMALGLAWWMVFPAWAQVGDVGGAGGASPTPGAVVQKMLAAYRGWPVAQTIKVTVTSPERRVRSSRIAVRTSRGADGGEKSLGLELGRVLKVWGTTERFTAITPLNKRLVYVVELGELTGRSVKTYLREVPVPQIAWVLDELEPGVEGRVKLEVAPFGEVEFDRVMAGEGGRMSLAGSTALGPVVLVVNDTGLLERANGYVPVQTGLGAGERAGQAAVEMVFEPVEAGLGRWEIDTANRERVRTMADLKPAPAEVPIGSALPGLGLMGPDLAARTLREELAGFVSRPTERGSGPVLMAVVLHKANVAEAQDLAFKATMALRAVKKSLDRRRLAGESPDAGAARLFILPVAVFDLADFRPDRPRALAEEWAPAGETVLWTSAGGSLLERFAPGVEAVLVLVDEDQRVRAILPLEGKADSADGLIEEVRALAEELTPAP